MEKECFLFVLPKDWGMSAEQKLLMLFEFLLRNYLCFELKISTYVK